MRTNGLIEIILYVADMQEMVAFYQSSFGLEVTFPQDTVDFQHENWVTLNAGGCVLALHAGGQSRLGVDTPKIVFGVDNIHTARNELLILGVTVGEVRSAAPGVWVCDGKDPEGHPFSIESQEQG